MCSCYQWRSSKLLIFLALTNLVGIFGTKAVVIFSPELYFAPCFNQPINRFAICGVPFLLFQRFCFLQPKFQHGCICHLLRMCILLKQWFLNFFHTHPPFSYSPPYKPKHCQFLPKKTHKKVNCKNFTLHTLKKQQTVTNHTDS